MSWSVRGRARARRLAHVAQHAAAPEPDLLARLDKLQDAANTASSQARNVYVTFLLFGLYLAIIFGATTHEQLLREGPVTLPLLSVALPLFGFFWIAPALFVLLHLNLLLQLYLLSGKLHRFDRVLRRAVARGHLDRQGANDRRAQLYPFPFSQMLVGRQHGRSMRFLLWLVVWLTVLVLPVVILLIGQAQFLPYHHAWTTMWQRSTVLADVLLILIFWRAIRYPGDRLLWHPGRWIWHQAKVLSLGLIALALSFVVFTYPGGGGGDFGDPMADLLAGYEGLSRLSQVVFATVPFLQRNLVVREVNLVASWPTQSQIDQFGEDLAWQNFGAPPDLHGRDLRYADFTRSIFVHGDFRRASLEGALLTAANLQGADLWLANLSGALLGGANLQDAYLFVASLQGANLAAVDLQGAILNSADLRGARLFGADLRGADLAWAKLHGTYFAGTDLGPADLEGASLSGADLYGAYLVGVNLRGASLGGASLQGAYLVDTDLRGASLRGVHLWRTFVGGSQWALANLTGARLDPITDLDTWIDRETAEIANEATRSAVKDRLVSALKSDLPSDVPVFPDVWGSSPEIMFGADGPLAVTLGWGVPSWETQESYDRDLAGFLGDIACDENASIHVARRFAESAVEPNPFQQTAPLLHRLLAARLLGEDCPPAAELSEEHRSQLRELVSQTSR